MKSFAVLAVLGVLSAAVCSVASADVKFKMASQGVHSEEDLEGMGDFLKCAAKCLGETAMAIFKDCNFNMTCWKKEIMGRAGGQAFVCAVKCFDLKTRDAALVLLDDKPADNGFFIVCVAKCIGMSVTQVGEWYRECGRNLFCWAKKVGWAAAKCVGSCLISEEIEGAKVAVSDGPSLTASSATSCTRRGNLYTVVPNSDCTAFTQQDLRTNKTDQLYCPSNLQFNVDVCVCDYRYRTKCANGPFPKPSYRTTCYEKGNEYKIVPGTGCKNFTQRNVFNNVSGMLQCPKGLQFNVRPCVCDYPYRTRCALPMNNQENLPAGLVAGTNTEVELPDFVKCLAKCLGKSLTEMEQWFKECGNNKKCWLKKVGFKGLKCVGSCIKFDDETSDVTSDENVNKLGLLDATKTEVELPDFVKCLAKCLGKSLAEIEQWFKECGKNKKCWAKKVGFKGLKCVGSCIKFDYETSDVTSDENAIKLGLLDGTNTEVEIPDFVKCLAKCLGKSLAEIEQWFKECGNNKKCWAKKVGFKGLKCVGSCIKFDVETSDVTSIEHEIKSGDVKVRNAFLNCMARCLGKSLADIEQWYNECGTDGNCWLKKVGFKGLTCAGSCILYTESLETSGVDLEETVLTTNLKGGNRFLNCMAKCLGKSLADIEQWYNECGTNGNCWLKKVGFKGLTCAGRCILFTKSLESHTEKSVTNSPPSCTRNGIVYTVVPDTDCRTFTQRTVKTNQTYTQHCPTGLQFNVDVCVCDYRNRTKCTATQPIDHQSDASVSEECVAKCLGGSQPDVAKLSSKCYSDIRCWMREVGAKGFLCAASCLSAKEKTPAESYSFSATLTASSNKS